MLFRSPTYGYYRPLRILKLTQNPDGSPGTVSAFAGDCTDGTPTDSADALHTPLTHTTYSTLFRFAVWNQGDALYYSPYNGSGKISKIISGKYYTTSISSVQNLAYDSVNHRLITTPPGLGTVSIHSITPVLSSAKTEVVSPIVQGGPTNGGCGNDGVVAVTNACVLVSQGFVVSSSGTLFFTDGSTVNSPSDIRIRYIGSDGKIRTLMGTQPFMGKGLDRRVIRGALSGIYYKRSTEPNQASFPEGLYFTDRSAMMLGHIDPTNGTADVVWGNQVAAGGNTVIATGTPVTSDTSMGAPYGGGRAYGLAFDSQGLPWVRYGGGLASLDSNKKITNRMVGGVISYTEQATEGINPYSVATNVGATGENITLKPQGAQSGLFFLGGYSSPPSPPVKPAPVLTYFDFDSATTHLIINNSTAASSPDNTPAGSASLPSYCYNNLCRTLYDAAEDRLYFQERGNSLRYLTTPGTQSTATLGTLFTLSSGGIQSFIFSADKTKVFYIAGASSKLRCHSLIAGGSSWCNDTDLWSSGVPTVSDGTNQMTWRDDGHLLISTYGGNILEYELPQGPVLTGLANDTTPTRSKSWSWGCSQEPCTYLFTVDSNPATIPSGGFSDATSTSLSSGTGTHYLHILAKNSTGTTSQLSHFSVEMDNTAPAITISSPAMVSFINASSNLTAYTVSGGCETGLAITVSVTNGATTVNPGTQPTCSSGSYSTTVNISSLADGALTFRAAQTDAAGNAGTTSVPVTKDVSPPQISSFSVNDGDATTGSVLVTVKASLSNGPSGSGPLQLRIAEAHPVTQDCQSE